MWLGPLTFSGVKADYSSYVVWLCELKTLKSPVFWAKVPLNFKNAPLVSFPIPVIRSGWVQQQTHPKRMTGIWQLTWGAFILNAFLWNPHFSTYSIIWNVPSLIRPANHFYISKRQTNGNVGVKTEIKPKEFNRGANVTWYSIYFHPKVLQIFQQTLQVTLSSMDLNSTKHSKKIRTN